MEMWFVKMKAGKE